jgi:hypothetical protein
MKKALAERGSTLFLRLAIIVIGLAVLAICVLALIPNLFRDNGGYSLLLIGMNLAAIPFLIGLYQGWRLLGFIDKNTAFSKASVAALGVIKYCAIIIGVIYVANLPWIYHLSQQTDAPGLMVIGLILTGGPLVVAVFAAVLQKLLRNAIRLKSENDLTV